MLRRAGAAAAVVAGVYISIKCLGALVQLRMLRRAGAAAAVRRRCVC